MQKLKFFLLVICYIGVQCDKDRTKQNFSTHNAYPCNGSNDIKISFVPNEPNKEDYQIFIDKTLTRNTKVILTLDTDSVVTLRDTSFARIYTTKKNTFEVRVFKLHEGIMLDVKGQVSKTVPQIKSLIINNKEFCRNPSLVS
ncbi:jg14903 [Pararge aegeria aegeria]|uniref:Jg14903 protein n=1 Tax=Pararge aegeria aegeria TaxID=348720 RepID=A0A8S4QF79_9NEOP|nr:jg14903 [Pararge aegeria aegeria]